MSYFHTLVIPVSDLNISDLKGIGIMILIVTGSNYNNHFLHGQQCSNTSTLEHSKSLKIPP